MAGAPPLRDYAVPGAWGGPGWQAPLRTPGTVIAAAVLTYIQAGFGIVGGLALLALSTVSATTDVGIGVGSVAGGLAIVTVGLSALYVMAAVQLQRGRSRTFLLTLTIIGLALGVIGLIGDGFLVATGRAQGASSVCSLVIPVVVLILLLNPATTQWIEARRIQST